MTDSRGLAAGAPSAADAVREGVAGHVEAPHGVAEEDLLRDHESAFELRAYIYATFPAYIQMGAGEKKPTARVGFKSFARRTSLGL